MSLPSIEEAREALERVARLADAEKNPNGIIGSPEHLDTLLRVAEGLCDGRLVPAVQPDYPKPPNPKWKLMWYEEQHIVAGQVVRGSVIREALPSELAVQPDYEAAADVLHIPVEWVRAAFDAALGGSEETDAPVVVCHICGKEGGYHTADCSLPPGWGIGGE